MVKVVDCRQTITAPELVYYESMMLLWMQEVIWLCLAEIYQHCLDGSKCVYTVQLRW